MHPTHFFCIVHDNITVHRIICCVHSFFFFWVKNLTVRRQAPVVWFHPSIFYTVNICSVLSVHIKMTHQLTIDRESSVAIISNNVLKTINLFKDCTAVVVIIELCNVCGWVVVAKDKVLFFNSCFNRKLAKEYLLAEVLYRPEILGRFVI